MAQSAVETPITEEERVASVDRTIWKYARLYGRGLGRDALQDLHAVGVLAALGAARTFDPRYGASFNTYATYAIRSAVGYEAVAIWTRGMCRATNSAYISRVYFAYGRARRRLEADGIEPSTEELAKVIDVPPDVIRDAISTFTVDDVSYDESLNETLRQDEIDPLESLCDQGTRQQVLDSLDQLTLRERRVVIERFFEDKTRAEIAVGLSLTSERVRQIEGEALTKLRRWLKP